MIYDPLSINARKHIKIGSIKVSSCYNIYHLETARFNGRRENNRDSHLSSFQKHHIRCAIFEKIIDVREDILTFPPLKRRVSR
jgi:hypothetical protein